MRQNADYIEKARANHHEALRQMLPSGDTRTGKEIWRKLRIFEARAANLALRMCNGPEVTEEEKERVDSSVTAGVEKIFGRKLPGFFINHDPRGFALKLEPGSVPFKLHQDWGGYQILAPLID